MSGSGWRPHLEGAIALDIWSMCKLGALRDGSIGTWQWTRSGDPIAAVRYAVSLKGNYGTLALCYTQAKTPGKRDTVCVIRLSAIPLHYGGRRWYGHCPYSGRRARKLYKFYGIEQFCHRMVIRPLPTYASQRLSGLERVQAQRWALRRKLGDDYTGLLDEPMKPRRMRYRTFERYAARDLELAAREDAYSSRALRRLLKSLD